MKAQTGIKVTTYTASNQIYKVRVYKNKRSASRGVTKQNLGYGAHLRREAIDLSTGQSVIILS